MSAILRYTPDPNIKRQNGLDLEPIELPYQYANKSLELGKYSKFKVEAPPSSVPLISEFFPNEELVYGKIHNGKTHSDLIYTPPYKREEVSPYLSYSIIIDNEKVILDDNGVPSGISEFRNCDIHLTGKKPIILNARFVNCDIYGKHDDKNIPAFSSSVFFNVNRLIGGASFNTEPFLKDCRTHKVRFKLTNYDGSALSIPIEGGALNDTSFDVTKLNVGTGTLTTKMVGHAVALKNVALSKVEFGSIDVFAENCEGAIISNKHIDLNGGTNSVIVHNTNGKNPPVVVVGESVTSLQIVNLNESEVIVALKDRDTTGGGGVLENLYVTGKVQFTASGVFATTMRDNYNRHGLKGYNAQVVLNTSGSTVSTMGNHDYRLTEEFMGDFFKAQEGFGNHAYVNIPDPLLSTFAFLSKKITVNGDNLLGVIIGTITKLNEKVSTKVNDDTLNQVILIIHNGMKNEVPKDMDFSTEEGGTIIENIVARAFRLYKMCQLAKRVL